MLNDAELQLLINKLKTLAFYNEGSFYMIDDDSLKRIMDKIYKVVDKLNDQLSFSYQDDLTALNKSLKTFEQTLNNLKIPKKSFEDYLSTHITNDDIKHVQKFSDDLTYLFLPFVQFLNANTSSARVNLTDKINKVNSDTSYILNKHNPFADVQINNQAFLYFDKKGIYHTLAFTVGETLTKVENTQGQVLALKPNFKVAKFKGIHDPSQDIQADDTISSPMPEQNQKHTLYYL